MQMSHSLLADYVFDAQIFHSKTIHIAVDLHSGSMNMYEFL